MEEKLKSHFLNLYALALSDNEVDSREIAFLYKLGIEKGVEKQELEDIIINPDKVKFTIPENLRTKVEYLYDFTQMIIADGHIDEDEVGTLKKFCKKFGFLEENIEGIVEYLLNSVNQQVPKKNILDQITSAHE